MTVEEVVRSATNVLAPIFSRKIAKRTSSSSSPAPPDTPGFSVVARVAPVPRRAAPRRQHLPRQMPITTCSPSLTMAIASALHPPRRSAPHAADVIAHMACACMVEPRMEDGTDALAAVPAVPASCRVLALNAKTKALRAHILTQRLGPFGSPN
jgi:hypothetical protein